jgi:hypothetical protein
MERQDQHMLLQFTVIRSRLCHEANVATARFYLDIEDRIASWVESYTSPEPGHIWDVFVGDARTRLVKELTTSLTEQLQHEFEGWACSTLQPWLEEGLRRIAGHVNRQNEQLLWQDTRNTEHLGEDVEAVVQDAIARIVPAVIRYERFAWHPLVLIARLLEMASVQVPLKRCASQQKVRDAVAWAYRRELMATLQQRVSAIVGIVDSEIGKIQEKLSSALCLKLQYVSDRGQTGSAKEQLEHDRADRVMPLLIALEDELHEIESELAHLISTKEEQI